jgi:diguanylate cyclase (GGDEF)-like protein
MPREPDQSRAVVLLVEPRSTEAARLRNELIAGRLEVVIAGDLISTAHVLSLAQPNLILAQVRLPTFSGLELLRWLKDQTAARDIPVILYGEIATAEERIQAIELGAVDFLTRPWVSAELIARVRAALKARKALSVLEQKAHLDSLTGLSNRAVLEDNLRREWELCRRQSVPLSVLVVDLDRFKLINDTHGHAAGDIVLKQAAQILAQSVRKTDLVARYGGEEFVVVAPNCPQKAAVAVGNRFRTNLASHAIVTDKLNISVTASLGIATTDWTQHNAQELFEQADRALYWAKRSGRNTVWVYDTAEQTPVAAEAVGLSSGDPANPPSG